MVPPLLYFHALLNFALGALFSRSIPILFGGCGVEPKKTPGPSLASRSFIAVITLIGGGIGVLGMALVIGAQEVLTSVMALGAILELVCQVTLVLRAYRKSLIDPATHHRRSLGLGFYFAGFLILVSLSSSLILLSFISTHYDSWVVMTVWLSVQSISSAGVSIILILSRLLTRAPGVRGPDRGSSFVLFMIEDGGLPSIAQITFTGYFLAEPGIQRLDTIFPNLSIPILYAITIITCTTNSGNLFLQRERGSAQQIKKSRTMADRSWLGLSGINHGLRSKGEIPQTPTDTLIIHVQPDMAINPPPKIFGGFGGSDAVESLCERTSSLPSYSAFKRPSLSNGKGRISDLGYIGYRPSSQSHKMNGSLNSRKNSEASLILTPSLAEESSLGNRAGTIRRSGTFGRGDEEGVVIEEWPEIRTVQKIKLEPRGVLFPSQRPKKKALSDIDNDSLDELLLNHKPIKTSPPVVMELSDVLRSAPPQPTTRLTSPEFRDVQIPRRPSSPGSYAQGALEEIRRLFPPKLSLTSNHPRKLSNEFGTGDENEENAFWGRHRRATKKLRISSFNTYPLRKVMPTHLEMTVRERENKKGSTKLDSSDCIKEVEEDLYRSLESYRFGNPVKSDKVPSIEVTDISSTVTDESMTIRPSREQNGHQSFSWLTPVLDRAQQLTAKSVDNLLLGRGKSLGDLGDCRSGLRNWFERRPSAKAC
ncbi:hypothetical protein CROQUDRAFT_151542 [Cronartium quercuum f. sp. fusiforme G11]|uniref:Uncharacterized protein n=1 Tax=Cronartium quercuum f. sp. fusiforme G11 TaxID=708437 RepID=A0A9P6NYD4_9BASI|nr:hypothetical protein CROQUDRAFT_151542 [Cronartium quercuum f. sp. fusiforme G11]